MLDWERRPLLSIIVSHDDLVSAFGAPDVTDVETNGAGLGELWRLRLPCGLQLRVLLFPWMTEDGSVATGDRAVPAEVYSDEPNAAHVIFHLPVLMDGEPARTTDARWVVFRQDDNAQEFEVSRFGSRCEAEAEAASLQSLGHKQTYWVGQR